MFCAPDKLFRLQFNVCLLEILENISEIKECSSLALMIHPFHHHWFILSAAENNLQFPAMWACLNLTFKGICTVLWLLAVVIFPFYVQINKNFFMLKSDRFKMSSPETLSCIFNVLGMILFPILLFLQIKLFLYCVTLLVVF